MNSDWQSIKAKYLLIKQNHPCSDMDGVVTAFRDGEVVLRSERRTEGFTEATEFIGYQGVRKGELVVHSMDAFAGAIGISKSDGRMSPVVHIYRGVDGVDLRYYAYYLKHLSNVGYIQSLSKGIRERSTSFDPAVLKELVLPLPPIQQQRRIADYLDNQLDAIHKLEENANSLFKLNRESLRSQNEHFFTKSEAPRVPLRRIARAITDKKVDQLPTVSLDLVQAKKGKLNVIELPLTDGLTATRMQAGDVAFGKLRPYLGKVYLAADETFAESEFVVMRTDRALLSPHYLSKFLLTQSVLNELESLSVGAKMPRTSWEQIASLQVPLPEQYIQQEICNKIAVNESMADKKEEVLVQMSEKLDEYRLSLISGVVTGTHEISIERRA
jgi:type I restriction enzyme S subunit